MKINIPSSLRLRNLLYNKKFTVALSIVMSFVIWLTISIEKNDIRQQTFTDISASISIENTAAADMGLGIISDVSAQKFSVTVSGPDNIVSSLKSDDFSLSASVIDVNAAGTYTLEVLGTSNSSKSGYTFTSISPSTIDVTFDYIDTKEFTLQSKILGVSASEGLVAEAPIVSNAEQNIITIKGPRTIVDKIATVVALAEVNETLSTSQTYDADIVLYDDAENVIYKFSFDGTIYDGDGNKLETTNLNLSFNSVKITQPISKKATVVCKPVFNNLPSGISEDDIKYKLDYSKVTIIGTPDVVDKIESISLSAIDFTKVSTTSHEFEVSATLPDGVKILENIEFFTVDINVSNYAETTLDIKNIRCIGIDSSLTAKTDTSIKKVKICGPKEVINVLKASDLYAVVDLTNKGVGDYTVDATIKSDIYDNIWQVGTYSTPITLK